MTGREAVDAVIANLESQGESDAAQYLREMAALDLETAVAELQRAAARASTT